MKKEGEGKRKRRRRSLGGFAASMGCRRPLRGVGDAGTQGLRKKGGPTTLLTRFAEELRRVLGIKGLGG